MKSFIFSIAVILTAAVYLPVSAQNKNNEKYIKASEEVRKQVWAWDKPQFKPVPVPEKYAKASKVVLAQHTELTADSKSKFAFYVVSFSVKKEQTITEVVREMVKLNDKNAVAEYSELSFTQFAKTSGFFYNDKTTTYIGVRVIKPNGNVKEINADEVVLTKDESTEKKAKLAIPDLEPGDILDYFIATEQLVTNDFSNKAYRIMLFDDAPIMNLSFHAQLGKKYAVEYRSYNGAPELAVSKNDDNDIIIDVEKKDLPPFETSLWVAPAIQLPFIRMNISLGYKGLGSRYMNTNKPGEVSKNKNSEDFIEDLGGDLSSSYYSSYWMRAAKAEFDAIENDAKKKSKQAGLNFKDMSNDEKAAQLYYTLRFTKLLNFDINALSKTINLGNYNYNGFAFVLFCTFKAAGIDPSIILSNTRNGYRLNEIMDSDDLVTTAYLPASKKYFTIQSIYDIPFTMPDEIEGVKATKNITFRHPAMVTGAGMLKLAQLDNGPEVPITTAEKNAHIENLKISLTAEKTGLSVQRSTTVKGYYKRALQGQLILYEDYYEAERKAFKEEKSLMEELEDGKKSKKYADEVKNAFAEARKKQKDAFVQEAKDWFEQDITELKDHKTVNLGVRHTAPDFIYSSSFKLDGLVKKAGNNIIIEIGKIQGSPLSIKDEQRKRDIDVYMPYARSIEYNIEIEIPDGYSAEGVNALNKKVETDAGFFIVEAGSTNKTVNIKLRKHYLHGFEPVKNWDKILAFTDAANEWVNTKLLLKKK